MLHVDESMVKKTYITESPRRSADDPRKLVVI